jgi:putative NADPH-quinone reductase
MKECLLISANPNKKGFGAQLTEEFVKGLNDQGNTVTEIDLFAEHFHCNAGQSHKNNDFLLEEFRREISMTDAVAFSFPMWCEMPPFPMVAFMQQILVKGFAYEHDGKTKTPILDLPTSLIVTMGQKKDAPLQYLIDALSYTGLHLKDWQLVIANGIGPNLAEAEATTFKERARKAGTLLFT